jgi:MYXO-CTERM domain-containing protein
VTPVQQVPAPVQPAGGAVAAAPVSTGTNVGYNAQTAVGADPTSPAWLGGVGALVAAGAAVAVRRRSEAQQAG